MNNRKNCPKCYRPNSVRIIIREGKEIEHCFGVDCNYYKTERKEFDVADLLEEQSKKHMDTTKLMDYRSYPKACEFVHKYRCGETANKIYYYPQHDRIVFNYKDLYVGKALDKAKQPKWYVYSEIDYPFVAQKYEKAKTDSVVLVEDCVSACNAARFMDSIALLGTTLNENYLTEVFKYDIIYIALDQDASSKALKMQQVLELVKDTKVIFLEKDIKYLGLEELELLFR